MDGQTIGVGHVGNEIILVVDGTEIRLSAAQAQWVATMLENFASLITTLENEQEQVD